MLAQVGADIGLQVNFEQQALYVDEVSDQLYVTRPAFSGAACATVTFNTSEDCDAELTAFYVAEQTSLQYTSDYDDDLSGYYNKSLDGVGVVQNSACITSCTDFTFSLLPNTTYTPVVAWDVTGNCTLTHSLTVHTENASGAAHHHYDLAQLAQPP